MRYFLLTIESYGNEGYHCNQIRKKQFEIENFRAFFVNPCQGQPGNGKARRKIWNNFYPGLKFLQ